MIHSEISYVPTPKGDRLEPALLIARGRKAVAIPLSMAHEFIDDASAIAKAVEYATLLYGSFIRADVFRLVDLITSRLVDLVSAPPGPALNTPERVQRQLASQRVHLTANGETLLDAR